MKRRVTTRRRRVTPTSAQRQRDAGPRRAKILCTLGPASSDDKTLIRMIDSGMDAARLNFSHGQREDHRAHFDRVHRCAAAADRPIAVVQDLQGPKIRVGRLPDGVLELNQGAEVLLLHAARSDDKKTIPCTYDAIARDLKAEDPILLDDGRLRLEVIHSDGHTVRCRVMDGGMLLERKGINLPGVKLSTPALTEKDREDLAFGLELGVDYIALSFVRSPNDVEQARELAGDVPLIAKIEKPEAVEAIEEILDIVDGIMIARGDLGVEIGPERVPILQKQLIEQSKAAGRLVITATDMLDSMQQNPRPTRAEVSDVANAVLDGTDTVMLSGETAAGRYPVEAVRVMDRVIREIEASTRYRELPHQESLNRTEMTNAIAHASVVAARELNADAIICFTEGGNSAGMISEYRPSTQLIAVTLDPAVYRRMALTWGITPLKLDSEPANTEALIEAVTAAAKRAGLVGAGQEVVVAVGSQLGDQSDLIKLLRLS